MKVSHVYERDLRRDLDPKVKGHSNKLGLDEINTCDVT